MSVFWARSRDILRAGGETISKWFQAMVDRSLSCRECDGHVEFFERVCPCCGAYGPTRVPLPAATILMLVPPLFLLFYFWAR